MRIAARGDSPESIRAQGQQQPTTKGTKIMQYKLTNQHGAVAIVPAQGNSRDQLESLGYRVEVMGRDERTHEISADIREALNLAASPYAEPGERWEDYLPPVTAQPSERR
jgi:hypothetical protein